MLLGEEVAKWVWLGLSSGLFCLQGLCPLANEYLRALYPGAKLEPKGRTEPGPRLAGHSPILRHGRGGTCTAESGSKAPPPSPLPWDPASAVQVPPPWGPAAVCKPKSSQKFSSGTKKGGFFQRGSLSTLLSQEERESVKLDESRMPVEIYKETLTWELMKNKIRWACWFCGVCFQYAFISFATPLSCRVFQKQILSHCKDGEISQSVSVA